MATLVYVGVKEKDINPKYTLMPTKNQYEKARFTGFGTTLILYTSGKLVVQGKEDVLTIFENENLHLNSQIKLKKEKTVSKISIPDSIAYIGSDETLKGDTFGGLVVVGAYFKKSEEDELKSLGVTDSKKLTDLQIVRIAQVLLDKYVDRFVIKNLEPKQYNQITSNKSITILLNELHQAIGVELKNKFGNVPQIVDQYPGCNAGDVMMEKAEIHSIAVAAASIVARYYGLKQFEKLSLKVGFNLPMGSTHVSEALEMLKSRSLSFEYFAKLHFKNVKNV